MPPSHGREPRGSRKAHAAKDPSSVTMSADTSLRVLMTLSPAAAAERVASLTAPPNPSDSAYSHDSGSAANLDFHSALSDHRVVGDAMNNIALHLLEAAAKKQSAALLLFVNTVSSHAVFLKSCVDEVDWSIESVVVALTSFLTRGRSSKQGQAVTDAVRAGRGLLILLLCAAPSFLEARVASSTWESLLDAVLAALPKPADKRLAISNELCWVCFALLGHLVRAKLVPDHVPPSSGHEAVDWADYFRSHCDRLVQRKQAQLKAAKAQDTAVEWQADEAVVLDALCLAMTSWILGMPDRTAVAARSTNGRYAFVWSFITSLADVLETTGLSFAKSYLGAMTFVTDKSSAPLLGLPCFTGLVYQEWWETVTNRDEFTALECDEKLAAALSYFSGKAGADTKALGRGPSSSLVRLFRDAVLTVESGGDPTKQSLTAKQTDLLVDVGIEDEDKTFYEALVNESFSVGDWGNTALWRQACEFGGSHSIWCFVINVEEVGDVSIFSHIVVTQNAKRATTSGRSRRKNNRKALKQHRQGLKSAKETSRWAASDESE